MSQLPLTNEQLLEMAPALFTTEPHYEVSDKYHFIPTIDVIEEIRSHNWYPVLVSEARVRNEEKQGFQQHLVRFRHLEDLIKPKENAIELLLFNSHDRSKSFSVSIGIYRFVCANGLVIASNMFETYKIRHISLQDNDVSKAITKITELKPKILNKIKTFESINLTDSEKETFAKLAIPLRFEEHLQINPIELLTPHREEDNKDDLYTVLNVIQENLLRGNISGINKNTNRKFTSKEISSISKDVVVNKGLWEIAEKIARIKEPQVSLAA